MPKKLPQGLRARAYAGLELLLDFSYIANGLVGADYESMIIYVCVAEATMRPLVRNADAAFQDSASPPEHLRGSISRLAIADRTGIARETVRRKVKSLIEKGLLFEDAHGAVRSVANLADAGVQKAIAAMDAAVLRYQANTGGKRRR